MAEPLVVTPAEAGQKLLQFLSRRFNEPAGVLHRWIRTGQVRINGKRASAFDRVAVADLIRIPPFAGSAPAAVQTMPPVCGVLPPLVAETDEYSVFLKPAGLPVHPGTGHTDCLTARLEQAYAGADFMPTPVHRLDRDTSGVLLVAKTYRATRFFSEALARHDGSVVKEYLAWVAGSCPWKTPVLLEDRVLKQLAEDGRERMRTAAADSEGQEARLAVRCLEQLNGALGEMSLVQIRLYTGRTHQIRLQLAERGFPLLGDVKYGGPACPGGLKLHAFRLLLEGQAFEALPDWKGECAVYELPNPLSDRARPLPARYPARTEVHTERTSLKQARTRDSQGSRQAESGKGASPRNHTGTPNRSNPTGRTDRSDRPHRPSGEAHSGSRARSGHNPSEKGRRH